MKWKKNSSLSVPASTALDEHIPVPMLPIDKIANNVTALFANLFNLIPPGIHTIDSVSPSLEVISFSVDKTTTGITWGDDFNEFMDSLVCRMALTGQAIVTLTSFPEDGLKVKHKNDNLFIVIRGWHLSGDASAPVSFTTPGVRQWYSKYGRKRPNSDITFAAGYAL